MKLIKTKLQNGMDFWYKFNDKFVGQRIALRKYEEYESLLMLRNVDKNSVVVDVGANIGYYTLLLAKICKKVYAIEPDKECFEILFKNVEENNLKNVVLINKAVSDKEGEEYFMVDNENFGNHKIVTSNQKQVTRIKTIKLDQEIQEKIDLMKIDVQGHEPQVIAGAKNIIKKYSPILFLEYNGDSKMIEYLKKYYKNIFSIDYWFYVLNKGIKIDNKTGYTDLLITNKNIEIWERYKNLQWKKVIKKIIRVQ